MSHQTLIWGYCAYFIAGHSPIVEATGETIVVYALYLTSQFRWSHHWAVTLSLWPCLLYSSTLVGRGRKKNPWHCSKRVGDVGPDVMVYLTRAVIGLGGRGVIKNTDWSWSGCKSAPLHADVRSHLSGSSANSAIGGKWGKLAPHIFSSTLRTIANVHIQSLI